MANGDNTTNKTPTWQWIAGLSMSGLMFFSSLLLLMVLADMKEGRAVDVKLDLRLTTIEQTMPMQFEAIKEWREEIRYSLEKIANNQRYNASASENKQNTIIKGQESAAKIKDFNRIK